MTFTVANVHYSLNDFMRRVGYKPIAVSPQGQLNCVRPLGADYPRFHAYVEETPQGIKFNLHLDQKKSSYEGSRAHNGEYDGETVENERHRILDLAG
jgi:hypothetical protein